MYKLNPKIKVRASVDPTVGIITTEVEDLAGQITRRAIETEDAMVASGLRSMGWRSPEQVNKLRDALEFYQRAMREPDEGRGTMRDATEWLVQAATQLTED